MDKIQSDLQSLSLANSKQQSCITNLYMDLQHLSNAFEFKVTGKFQGIINWDHLRFEIIVFICKFLPLKQLLNLRLVNKSFYLRINYGIPSFIQFKKEKIENIESKKIQVDDIQMKTDISNLKLTLHQINQNHTLELMAIKSPHPLVLELFQRAVDLVSDKEVSDWGYICFALYKQNSTACLPFFARKNAILTQLRCKF